MKFIKQYPYISSLLIFSAVLSFIGFSTYMSNFAENRYDRKYSQTRYGQSNTSTVAMPVSGKDKLTPPSGSTVLKKVGAAEATYDEYLDSTMAKTEYLSVRKVGSDEEFTFIAYFEHKGSALKVPDYVFLTILSLEETETTNCKFKIYLDGRLAFNSKCGYKDEEQSTLTQQIPYELFVKITKSKKARLQVGKLPFNLRGNELRAFRDFVELVESTTITSAEKVTPVVQEKITTPRSSH